METFQTLDTPRVLKHSDDLPLFVDLDGTLVRSDTLIELLLVLLKKMPLCIFLLPFWLLRGKAQFKRQIAGRVDLDVSCLPYEPTLLSYLVEQRQLGRQIILATAADESIAAKIARHVDLFSAVLASDGATNLSGHRKLEKIRERVGSDSFVYAGNAKADLPIWHASRRAILVNCPPRLRRRVSGWADVNLVITSPKNSIQNFFRAIRAYQWVKNGLIFVPLIAGHHFTDAERLLNAFIAVIAFSMCSSSCYLVNDLLDLEADRRHPFKRRRPFASGDLSGKFGLVTFPILAFGGAALSLILPFGFTVALAAYYVLTFGYSFYIKKLVILDVIVLALLYALRIIAGGVATNIRISNWLLIFSMFLFLSLALLKRYSELHDTIAIGKPIDTSRGYLAVDVDLACYNGLGKRIYYRAGARSLY